MMRLSEADGSATSRPIETAPVTKTMYAKNGVIAPFTTVSAGDLITYRIQTTSPSTDFQALTLTDFVLRSWETREHRSTGRHRS